LGIEAVRLVDRARTTFAPPVVHVNRPAAPEVTGQRGREWGVQRGGQERAAHDHQRLLGRRPWIPEDEVVDRRAVGGRPVAGIRREHRRYATVVRGTALGRSQVLEIVTARPSWADSMSDSITSS